MGFLASIDGRVVPADEARVSVLDTGFTFGDGVYETLRTYGGRPFEYGRHLRRLRASAERLGIRLAVDDGELRRRLDELLLRAGNRESFVRLIVTRGVGDCSYHFERVQGPTVVLFVRAHETPSEDTYTQGLDVALASVRRNHPQALDPAIKAINLLNNVLAVREAQARGASEALLLNQQGELAEGASSNVFVVRGGRVSTPPLSAGILAGITRDVVIEVAPGAGHAVCAETLTLRDLQSADEAFITSSLKEVAPIRRLDGQPIGDGRPGPVTLALLRAYRAYIPAHCE